MFDIKAVIYIIMAMNLDYENEEIKVLYLEESFN